jgi:transposase
MAKVVPPPPAKRRRYTDEFRRDAVQMLLDGHAVGVVAGRLGIDAGLLYLWKRKLVAASGPVAGTLEERVRHLEAELLRVERERDILKKALAIFGRGS